MQAQSPFLKFNASDARSHQSPRKKKLQSQLTLLSSPAPSNEFENLLTGDSKAAKVKESSNNIPIYLFDDVFLLCFERISPSNSRRSLLASQRRE